MHAFIVNFLDRIIYLVFICENFKLVPVAGLCTGANWFMSYLVGDPDDRRLPCNSAHFVLKK